MTFKHLLTVLLLSFFSIISTGCASNNTSSEALSFLGLANTAPIDRMPDGREIYYVALEADFKCLIRTKKGRVYQQSGKYDEALFICFAQDRQDGMWDVVRFRYPNGQRERTHYRYNSEASAYKAVFPVIYK